MVFSNLPNFGLATLVLERTKVHNILVFIGEFGLYEPSESMVAAESSNFTVHKTKDAVIFVWFLVHHTINLNLNCKKTVFQTASSLVSRMLHT